jgi:hypothetical protein
MRPTAVGAFILPSVGWISASSLFHSLTRYRAIGGKWGPRDATIRQIGAEAAGSREGCGQTVELTSIRRPLVK